MKKTILVFLLVTFGASTLIAQDYERAFGLRLGTMVGASYKQFLNTSQAIEAIVDLDIIDSDALSLRGTALYQFHFPISSVDGLAWYIGPGATFGLRLGDDSGFLLGLDGMVGLEYKLSELPLCFSIDYNPKFYLIGYDDPKFKAANAGLTIRYTF